MSKRPERRTTVPRKAQAPRFSDPAPEQKAGDEAETADLPQEAGLATPLATLKKLLAAVRALNQDFAVEETMAQAFPNGEASVPPLETSERGRQPKGADPS